MSTTNPIEYLIVGGGGSGYDGSNQNYIGGGGGGGGVVGTEKTSPLGSLTGTYKFDGFSGGINYYSQKLTLNSQSKEITDVVATFYCGSLTSFNGVFTVDIYDVDATTGEPTGSSLATASKTEQVNPGQTSQIDINFSTPFAVTQDTYAFVFSVNNANLSIQVGNLTTSDTFSSTDGTTWTAVDGPIGMTVGGNLINTISSGSYSVVIGAGGTGTDTTGGDSSFNSVTAHGGGRGGGVLDSNGYDVNGEPGASGGGATYYVDTGTGGTGTLFEGFAGSNSTSTVGGNGGGASEDGYTDSGSPGNGYGGEGYTSSINGTSDVYGSGGGAGWSNFGTGPGISGGTNAGTGAGGAVGKYPSVQATNPVANRGGGGGGRVASSGSTEGADGVVIVRYRTGDFGADSSGGVKTYINVGGVSYTVHTFNSSGTLVLTDTSGDFFLMM